MKFIEREVPGISYPFVYLGWRQDPTTTMAIHWITTGILLAHVVEYRELGGHAWIRQSGDADRKFLSTDKMIHWCELTGLSPNTEYEFRFIGTSKVMRFRTMPDNLDEPIKVAFGGDMYHSYNNMDLINRRIAESDPHFIVAGGDWAYADSKRDNAWKWEDLWTSWTKRMVDSEGRIIPVIPTIGNHEVDGGYRRTKKDAIYFYEMFSFPQDGYGVLDFGSYLSIIILDTLHTVPIPHQNMFLSNTLAARTNVKHVIPVYHLTAWPSGKTIDMFYAIQVRENWVPIFDEYELPLAFEHHDHTYKRTVPIRNGVEDPNGTVYLGDGCWGVGIRDVLNPATTWFLEDAKGRNYLPAESGEEHPNDGQPADTENARHFYLVTFENDKRTIESVNKDGQTFHTFEQVVR